MSHHEIIVRNYGLYPGTYNECEWVNGQLRELVVRRDKNDPFLIREIKAYIKVNHPTRRSIIEHFLKKLDHSVCGFSYCYEGDLTIPDNKVFDYLSLRNSKVSKLPSGLRVTGQLNIKGTSIKDLPDDLFCDELVCTILQYNNFKSSGCLPKGVGSYLTY